MHPQQINNWALKPALALLPERMRAREARAMLLTIGLQESRFQHRRQLPDGPANGFWQFERIAVREVMTHPGTRLHAKAACRALRYRWDEDVLYWAIRDNDILAAVFARLFLWRLPQPLPGQRGKKVGWRQYISAWRPGKPWEETWGKFWDEAWAVIQLEDLVDD